MERKRSRFSPDGEPAEVALRRFFREVQQSGLMTEIKKRRYFEKSPSRNARRIAAQERAARRKIYTPYE